MAACMSRHCLMLLAGAILALTFVHGLEAAVPSPDKRPCDKQDNDEPETLCRATINCHCISGTYLDIPCDTFDQDNIDCSLYCKACPDDKFSPFDNRCLTCRAVTPCNANEEVIKNATGRADQVCGCRRQDLTCPPCPEQTTPTFTSTQVETVVDSSVNPSPCPQKERATDPQWTFDGWSGVISIVVVVAILFLLFGILCVLQKTRGYRLRLSWEKVAKHSERDSERGGGQSVAMHGKGGPSASKGVESDVPPSNDGGDSVGGGDQSDALPSNMSNGGDDSAGGADKSDALPSNMSIGGDDSAVHDPENEGESQPLLLSSHQENKGNVKESMDGSLKRLKTCIEVFGRVDIQNNQGGGNCFFHAVVDQLEWLGILGQNSAKNLRIKLVEFLRQLQPDDPISVSLPASKHKRKEYLDKLAKDGTCVEAEDVIGTAKMLKCDLHVVVWTGYSHYAVDIKEGGTNGKRLSLGLVDQHYISLRSHYNRQAGVGAKPIDQHRAQQLDPSSSVQPKPSNKAQAQQPLPPDGLSVKPKPGNNNRTRKSGPSSSTRPSLDSRAFLQPQQSDPSSPIVSPNPEFYKPVDSFQPCDQLDSSRPNPPEIINSEEEM